MLISCMLTVYILYTINMNYEIGTKLFDFQLSSPLWCAFTDNLTTLTKLASAVNITIKPFPSVFCPFWQEINNVEANIKASTLSPLHIWASFKSIFTRWLNHLVSKTVFRLTTTLCENKAGCSLMSMKLLWAANAEPWQKVWQRLQSIIWQGTAFVYQIHEE